jgi:hypothetical protein
MVETFIKANRKKTKKAFEVLVFSFQRFGSMEGWRFLGAVSSAG